MKKLYLLLGLLGSTVSVFCQWSTVGTNNIFNNTSAVNVGIGTGSLFNPQYKLHIYDGTGNGLNGIGLAPGVTATDNTSLVSIKTSTSVNGFLLKTQNTDAFHGQSALFMNYANGAGQGIISMMSNTFDFRTGVNYTDNITSGSFGTSALYISNTQQVGIGTNSPGTFKLAVEGAIGARSVKVTTQNPWPDFVFAPHYVLTSLDSVGQYINHHRHLPGIPTADSVATHGIDLGDNQALLLQKIEEMTLYLLELQRQIRQQQEEIKALKTAQH